MRRREIEDIYPLSPMQQGMLFHTLLSPESDVYHEQSHWILRGALDVAAFARAWQALVDRHTVLRTSFVWEDLEEPLQVVHRGVELLIEHHDWRGLTAAEQEDRLEAFLKEDRERGFDLSEWPLTRVALLQIADDARHFVWSHHHTLLDGWSVPVLLQELFALYDAFRGGRESRLPPARPFRDYIAWLERQDLSRAETFWRQTLDGLEGPTTLPIERSGRPEGAEDDYRAERLALPRELAAGLNLLSRRHQITLNTLLQGAWALLLGRYNAAEDVVFGATVSGRPADLRDAEMMVGLFINTLPVRARVEPGLSTLDWLKRLQEQQVEARQFEYASLVQIQGWSDVPRDLDLFESILVFENYPVPDEAEEGDRGLTIESGLSFSRTNYSLCVSVSAVREEIHLEVAYDGRRFDTDAIRRMMGHLQTLLQSIAADPERPVGSLTLLTDADRRQVLALGAGNDFDDPRLARPVHALFEQQVAHNPLALAATSGDRSLTYAELNTRANRLAHHLIARGIGSGSVVALALDRSLDVPVAILGVLKAGAAYLPLDPLHPAERVAFMLDDAGASLLLTHSHLAERFATNDERRTTNTAEASLVVGPGGDRSPSSFVVLLDTDWDAIEQESAADPGVAVAPEALAYVIYTSGSTGQAKGVLVEHRSLVNTYLTWERTYDLPAIGSHLSMANIAFDVFSGDFVRALLSGGRLVLCPRELLLEPERLYALMQKERIEFADFVPAVLRGLIGHLEATGGRLEFMRILICGSDSWYVGEYRKFGRFLGEGTRFINAFGVTEATIDTTWFEGEVTGLASEQMVPIGRPFGNMAVYILDGSGEPSPIGVPGELYIGGLGVARGYLNRPELTAERFVTAPFTPSRLYRTGDRVRWLGDGNLEFLGRADDQVKIRGYRVELGEIEAALGGHPAVREVAVVAREFGGGDRWLVAYVVPTNDERGPCGDLGSRRDRRESGGAGYESGGAGKTTNDEDGSLVVGPGVDRSTSSFVGALRAHLKERLPDYMTPSAFVTLDALPLTPNGKLDRRALPDPEPGAASAAGGAAARTPLEELLAGLWAQVLGLEHVGVYDSFFDLGGHSLLATRLVSRVREVFAVELPLRELFDTPTVAGLAVAIEAARRDPRLLPTPIVPAPRDTDLPLSFGQQRLWFLDQLEPGNLFYNIPLALRLDGDLDVAALDRSLNSVVARHEALRTSFALRAGVPVQVIAPELRLPLPVTDLAGLPLAEREREVERQTGEEARRPFDLGSGPLLRARLLRLGEREHVAILVAHHVITDGWSMGLLIGELSALYREYTTGEAAGLVELPVQYGDYAAWQREWLQGEVLEAQLAYWKERLEGVPPVLELPLDRPRGTVQSARGAHFTFTLPATLVQSLNALSREEGVTLFMALLTGFQGLLGRYSGQEDVAVGTPIAGRNRSEVEGLIGFFVNTLVLRTDLSGEPTFRELLGRVREVTLGAYAHQDLPFERVVEAVQPERSLSHTPLFQVMFVMDSFGGDGVALPGLTLRAVPIDAGVATFDLTLTMTEAGEALHADFEYNTDLFDGETIQQMAGHLGVLLSAAVADPDHSIATLPLLTEPEQHQLLVDWNDTAAPFPADLCIHHRFEALAAKRPHHPALSLDGETLSYGELNARANQLAHLLLARGVGTGSVVGIATDRSFAMVVAILGVLKAGSAYLPLDPSYPAERLAFMIEDSGISLLLTQADLADRFATNDERPTTNTAGSSLVVGRSSFVVYLDADWASIARESEENPAGGATAESLAYVIYTSGSTGRPKGALLGHRGLVNLTTWQHRQFAIEPESRVLQFAPFSFDASVWETVMALGNGGTLCLAPQEEIASGQGLVRLLEREGITHVTLPPSVLRVLPEEDLPDLRVMITAGEACTPELVARWAPGRAFYNAYGPTETTVCASVHCCSIGDPALPPIGRPIANTTLYVLDTNGQPTPVGVAGELYIGGVGLARGYWNRPELTAERFVEIASLRLWALGSGLCVGGAPAARVDSSRSDTTSPEPRAQSPERLYRTGDRVRYRRDGNLEFLGRIDTQVKIRGFRIELGEIEAALREHAAVREAAVAADGDRLAAYLVLTNDEGDRSPPGPTTNDEDPSLVVGRSFVAELYAHLRDRLPEYMVPSAFIMLDALPLSPSGKVDRKALPAPDRARPGGAREYSAPRNETEAKVSAICAELLGLDRVGVEESFFELGGHSLLATQLVSRLREQFGAELPLRALFENPSVAGIAEVLLTAGHTPEPVPAITPLARERYRVKRAAGGGLPPDSAAASGEGSVRDTLASSTE